MAAAAVVSIPPVIMIGVALPAVVAAVIPGVWRLSAPPVSMTALSLGHAMPAPVLLPLVPITVVPGTTLIGMTMAELLLPVGTVMMVALGHVAAVPVAALLIRPVVTPAVIAPPHMLAVLVGVLLIAPVVAAVGITPLRHVPAVPSVEMLRCPIAAKVLAHGGHVPAILEIEARRRHSMPKATTVELGASSASTLGEGHGGQDQGRHTNGYETHNYPVHIFPPKEVN